MKIRRSSLAKVLVGAGAAALIGSVASPALAATYYSNYNVDMPVAQWQAQTGSQSKTYTNTSANVNVTSVGSNYRADVTICANYGSGGCGYKVTGLDDGSSARPTAPFRAGQLAIVGIFQSNTWNSVAVNVYGTWRAN